MSEEESSVLFSLKELMTIEEDRIQQEEDDRKRTEEEAERARIAAEAAARQAEEARRMAEEQRRTQEEQRRREEEARLEAIRQSEVEKARAEHEQRARMEAMAAQQEHERKLAALNQDEGKKRLRNIIVAGATVVVLGSSLAGYLWYQNKIEQEQKAAVLAAEAQRAKEEAEKKQRELEAKLSQIKELEDQIAKAADPAEIERLKRQLNEAKDDAKGLKGGGFRPGGKPAAGPAPKKTCAPGDPLCSDI